MVLRKIVEVESMGLCDLFTVRCEVEGRIIDDYLLHLVVIPINTPVSEEIYLMSFSSNCSLRGNSNTHLHHRTEYGRVFE